MMIQYILSIDIIIIVEIKLPHIFTPTKYLSNKSLFTRHWHIYNQSRINHFKRGENSKVYSSRKERMMNPHIILVHSIFEFPKIRKMILYEILQEFQSIFTSYWQEKISFHDIIVFFGFIYIFRILRLPIPTWKMFFIKISILMVIIPFTTNWLIILVNQNIATFSHVSIKGFHNRRFFKLSPKFDSIDEKLSIWNYKN